MAMVLSFLRVTPAAFAELARRPALLDGVLYEPDLALFAQLGLHRADIAILDYQLAADLVSAIDDVAEPDEPEEAGEPDGADDGEGDRDEADRDADGEREGEDDRDPSPAVYANLGSDGTLAYDAGFGPAVTLSPAAVRRAATTSGVVELDAVVQQLFEAAATRGDHVIAIVS